MKKIQALILEGKTLEQIIKELGSQCISGEFITANYETIKNDSYALERRKAEKKYEKAMEMAQSGQYTFEEIIAECGKITGYNAERIRYEIMYSMYIQGETEEEIIAKTGLRPRWVKEAIEFWNKSNGKSSYSIANEESNSNRENLPENARDGDNSKKTKLSSANRRTAILKLVQKKKATEEDLDFLYENLTEGTDKFGTIVYAIQVLIHWEYWELAIKIINKRLSYDNCDPKLKEKLKSLKELIMKKITTKKIIRLLKEGRTPIRIATELKVLEVDVLHIAREYNITIKPTYRTDEEYYIL